MWTRQSLGRYSGPMTVGSKAGEAVGAVLNGQWKLVRLVGEGGLAGVYEADGLQGQGKRAIKLLHPHFRSEQVIMERFYAEAQACFSLRHPHIAAVESYAYAEDGSPYIVMELLVGISIEDFLLQQQPMTPEQASPILYGMLQALAVAHARGIVHRDLKPANLFLVPDESGQYAVKVLDFGIAKVMDLAGGMGSKTRTGAILGTPGYMSPEQVKNAKGVDSRADLWAAGVVLYELLSGEHPFGMADQLARMVAVLRDPPKPIGQISPELAYWEPFFAKAIARDAAERFQSAEEMAERLRQVAQGTPARFVPEGLQTVALPMMPDLLRQHGGVLQPQGVVSPAAAQAAAPAPVTHPSPAAPASTYTAGQPSVVNPPVAAPPTAPGSAPAVVPMAPPAGAYPGGSTQVSEARPPGIPTLASDIPAVHIVDAADPESAALVWWGVVLVGAACFAAGVLLGYVIGAG